MTSGEVCDPTALANKVQQAIYRGNAYNLSHQNDENHWHDSLFCDVTVTCQYVFLMSWFGLQVDTKREGLIRHLRKQQRQDGSWTLSPDVDGTLSPSVEAYLALRLLGIAAESPEILRARDFIIKNGGLEECRITTRFWLATFGIVSWSCLPFSPAELIFIPPCVPFSIYTFAPWARALIVPYLVVMHYRPIFPFPSGCSISQGSRLEELWLNKTRKTAPYGSPLSKLMLTCEWTGLLLMLIDMFFSWLGILGLGPVSFIRKIALQRLMHWVLQHFEPEGDYNPGYPPGFVALLALHVSGIGTDDPRLQRGVSALEMRHIVHEGEEYSFRTCTTPVWDTILTSQALLDTRSTLPEAIQVQINERVDLALSWLRPRQYLAYTSDWSVRRPLINSGGFSIQYHNTWDVDIDDTAAAIVLFLTRDSAQLNSNHVLSAAEYIMGMQSKNGGWAAFEADNTNFYLRKLPFCDYTYMVCDPPVPDVTGHALEALGMMLKMSKEQNGGGKITRAILSVDRITRIYATCSRAIDFLTQEVEVNGSYFGRWQCNYLFGTGAVLCGLEHFARDDRCASKVRPLVRKAIAFLKSWQNKDGGWGEATRSYFWKPSAPDADATRPLRESTATQTAWALMGLIPYLTVEDETIVRGIRFLVDKQEDASNEVAILGKNLRHDRENNILLKAGYATWTDSFSSGASIPGWMSLHYGSYQHTYPLMALGRYAAKQRAGTDGHVYE